MNKRILIITLAALGLSFLVSSCVKNSELEGKVKDIVQLDSLNARMAALEARMKGINTDIATLKTAVEALRKNLYVTNVEQTTDGFKLTFSNGKTVTIKNGKDGKDGKNAPVVGVKDSLGTYYWVLVDKTQTLADTSWILDKELKKIPVSGKDGAEVGVKDTLTSVYWVKIDKSKSPADTTWLMDKDSNLVQAVGKDGESIFSGIDTTKTGYVVLTLASGTKIELPYKSELDKLVSRIQSVEVVPEYQDGSVGIKDKKKVTISFEVRPASLAAAIAAKGVSNFSLQAVETKAVTKAVTYYDLTVTDPTVGEDSLLTLTVSNVDLPEEFFAGTQPCNARLRISDGNTDKSSAYFPLTPVIETANCYIVSKAGTYKFRAVKGNSDVSVGDVKSVKVLWESYGTSEAPSVGTIIKADVKYENGYIIYSTNDTFTEGNAVIAAYSGDSGTGDILWSWHIWCTDQPADQVFSKNEVTMMDRNLGATSADKGQVSALGLLYQWGRKDPFLGADAKYYASNPKQAASTMKWPQAVAAGNTGESTNNLQYSIKNPTTYITNGNIPYDWYCTDGANQNNNLWKNATGSAKTIYDPCPVGYRVPDGGKNGVWATAGFTSQHDFDSGNKGMDFVAYTKSTTCWYPAAGFSKSGTGLLDLVGNYGGYWSCTPNSNDAYYLNFNSDRDVHPSNSCYRAYGQSVRCLKEE